MREWNWRVRSQSLQSPGGANWPNSAPEGNVPSFYDSYTSSVSDWQGVGDCWEFNVNRSSLSGGRINRRSDFFNEVQFVDWVSDKQRSGDGGYHGHWSLTTKSDGEYATETMKRTNPSRPYVDLGTFVAELKDIPGLIETTGRGLAKFLAANNMRYNFGLSPVVGDLFKMLNFQTQVDRRVDELNRLKTRGLRRTVDLDRISKTDSGNPIVQSYGAFLLDYTTWSTAQVVRGHARWKPTSPLPDTANGIRYLANRAVKGLTLDFSTAWELVPWSWLADWFSNIGDYIAAHRNIVDAECTTIAIMRHTTTSMVSAGISGDSTVDGLSLEPVFNLYETKYRRTATPSLAASFPFLSWKQMGIITSLSVLKGRR